MRRLNTPGWAKTLRVLIILAALSCSDGPTEIRPGASYLVFTVQPSSQAAGTAMDPAIQVTFKDDDGFRVFDANGQVTLKIESNPGGGVLGGKISVNAVGGVATFNNVSIDKVASGYTLSASAPAVTGVTSHSFDIGPGAPTQLSFTGEPSNVAAGQIITPPVEVTVLDGFGNVATDATVNVTVGINAAGAPPAAAPAGDSATADTTETVSAAAPAVPAAPAAPTLHGTMTVPAVNGVATFSDLWVDKADEGYTLTASFGSVTSPASAAFTTTPAAPVQIGFETQPSNGSADAPLAPIQVAIQDNFGNVVPGATTTITMSLGSNPSGATLSGTLSETTVNGVATFDDLSINLAETGYTLTATASGYGSTASNPFAIGSGAAAQLRFRTQPSDVPQFASIAPPVEVEVLDAFGNLLTVSQAVTIDLGANPGGGILSGIKTRSSINGVATFNNLSIDKPAFGYTLTASAPGLSTVTSNAFNVSVGLASQLRFRTQPRDTVAGATIAPTIEVEVLDATGNLLTGATNAVTMVLSTDPSGGTLSGTTTVNAVGGVATFNDIWVDKAANDYKLIASSGTLASANSDPFNITPGPTAKFTILDPTDGTVDNPILVTIQAQDAYGNVATNEFRGVTLLASGSATGEGRVDMLGGAGTLLISDQVAETVTLSLVDTEVTGLDVSSTQTVVFSQGVVTKFAILDPVDGVVNESVTVTVQAQDQFGNLVPDENRDVTLAASGSATGAGLVDIVNGVGTRDISDAIPETVNLTLQDTQGTGLNVSSTQNVIFTTGATVRYVILDPTDGTVDAPILVTVQAQDQYGNTSTGEFRGVTLLTSGSAFGGGRVEIVGGIGTLLISDQVAQTVTLSLVDTDLTGTDVSSTQSVVFAPGAVAKFAILDPNDGVVNTPVTVTVQAQDQYGNLVVSENRDVTLQTSGSATGAGLVDIQNGIGTRDINDAVTETVTLTLLDTQGTGLNVTSTQDVVFSSSSAVRYVIIDPADGVAGTPVVVTVRALDEFGNVATGEFRSVTMVASGSAAGSSGTVEIVAGIGSHLVNDQVAETVTLSLLDTQGTGLDVSSTQNVVFSAGPVARFGILDPTDAPVNQQVTVTVQAQDQYGNLVTTENRDVTLVASGSATGEGLVNIVNGVGTINITDAVAELVTLTLLDSQGTGLDVTSTQDVNFTSGAATRFVIVDPTDGTVDAPIVVTIRALDQFGNIVTSEFRGVTLLATGGAAGSSGRVDLVAGVGTHLIYDQIAQTVNLSLADTDATGLDVSSTQNVVFSAGAVTQFAILNPTDGVVNTPIPVTVQAQDQYGNLVASENRDVTLVTSGSATGGGIVNVQNGTGTRSINDAIPETVTLSLSDTQGTGLNVSSTEDVIFTAAAATRFVIVDPADGTAGTPIVVTIRALDQYGNIATGEFRGVTLLASGSAAGSSGRVEMVAGVGTHLINDLVAETVNLSLADTDATGLDVTSTQSVVFAPGGATQFAILDPTDGTVNTPITVTVQAQDQYGNVVTTENRDVTLVASGSATGDGIVNIQNGVGTLSINDAVPETVTLTLSDTQGTGLNVSSSQNVIFAAGTTTEFVILNPTDGTVNNPVLVTIHARDQFGNIATGEFRGVTLVASGNAAGSTGRVDFIAGVATHFVNDLVAETVNLSLVDSDQTGADVSSTQDLVFSAGPAASYTILDPTDATVSDPVTVTVQATDAFGNLATGENRDVTLNASGSATGDGLVNIIAGVGTIVITDAVPETVTLSLTDTQGTGLNVSSIQDVVFAAGAATRFVILNPVDGSVDNPIQVVVQAQDQFGNVVTGEFRDVTLVVSGSASGGGVIDIEEGVGGTFINDVVPETVTLSLLDTQATGLNVSSTQDVVFSVGATALFFIVNPPDGTVGNNITVTVQARDQFGNVVPTENRDVTLNVTGSATGGGLVAITSGTGSLVITDQIPETVFLTLSDTQGTGLDVSSQQDLTFAAAAATRFVLLDPVNGTVGNPVQVIVQAQDQFGNIVTSEFRDVTVATTGSATGGGVVDIQGGAGTIFINDLVPETVNLSLQDTQGTGLDVSSTQDVIFSVGAATRFFIVNPPDGTVGDNITVNVQAQDALGNVVTTENRDVTLNVTGSATGGGLVAITAGTGSLVITDQVPQTVILTLSDTQGTGLDVSSQQDLIFAPAAATRFVIIDPADGTVGNPVQVVVQAQDQFGNVVATESRDVTLNTTGSATGGGLVNIQGGVGALFINDLVPETVNLSLQDTQGTGLIVSSTQNVVFSIGAVAKFVILNPADGSVGDNITVFVQAQDQVGNVVTTENRDVTLLATGSATGEGLVNIQSGVGSIVLTDAVPETVILTLSDTQATGLDVSSQQDLVFNALPATQFVLLNPSDGTVDNPIQVLVQAQDQFGNVVTTESRDVTVAMTGSATGGGLVDVAGGTGETFISNGVVELVTLSLQDTQGTGLNVSSTQDVAFGPGAAVQFFIQNPVDGIVGTPVPVTVQARDQFGNVATGESRDVTLVASGSATVSNGGLVDIVSGTGSADVDDTVAETVSLTLSDTQGTGLNVASSQDVIFAAALSQQKKVRSTVEASLQ